MKKCCITGHRPKGFNWNYNKKNDIHHKEYLKRLKNVVERLITVENYDYFISGGAIGVDLDFAEIILTLKKKYAHIQLEIAIPCENQDLKWMQSDKERYSNILSQADVKTLISKYYTSFCMQKRNEYMVSCAEKVIAVWNGTQTGGTFNTINYAKRKNRPIEFIMI